MPSPTPISTLRLGGVVDGKDGVAMGFEFGGLGFGDGTREEEGEGVKRPEPVY